MTANKMTEIQFYGDTLIAVEKDGKNYVAIRRICNAIGVSYASQYRRLTSDPTAVVAEMATTGADGKSYVMTLVDWESVPKWLGAIRTNKVNPEVKEKLVKYQQEVKDVLSKHFLGTKNKPVVMPAVKQELDLFDDEGDRDLQILIGLVKTRKEVLDVKRAQEAQWAAIKATELLALEADQVAQKAIEVAQVADTKAEAAHKAITNATGWCSTMAYTNLQKLSVPSPQQGQIGKMATTICGERGIAVQKVFDPRWGKVGTYPKGVLDELLHEFIARSSTPQAVRQPIA